MEHIGENPGKGFTTEENKIIAPGTSGSINKNEKKITLMRAHYVSATILT